MRQFDARSFELDLDTGKAILIPSADNPLLSKDLWIGIDDAGFELLGLELELRGELQTQKSQDGSHRIKIVTPANDQSFELIQSGTAEGAELWKQFRSQAANGAAFRVRGAVEVGRDSATVLQLLDYEALDE